MSTENKLTYLEETKEQIKQSIIGKGVTVNDTDTFRSYADKINSIQSGGGDCPKYTLDLSDGVGNTFKVASEIDEIILPSSLPNVTNMSKCFEGFNKLTQITLPEIQKVKNFVLCFASCTSLTSITLPELPNVTNMDRCFIYCSSLQHLQIGAINPNIKTLSGWEISTCTLLTVDSLVNIMNALPTISDTRVCTIGTTNMNKLSPEQLAIGTSKGWSIN